MGLAQTGNDPRLMAPFGTFDPERDGEPLFEVKGFQFRVAQIGKIAFDLCAFAPDAGNAFDGLKCQRNKEQ